MHVQSKHLTRQLAVCRAEEAGAGGFREGHAYTLPEFEGIAQQFKRSFYQNTGNPERVS